jgi:hypothetical protein
MMRVLLTLEWLMMAETDSQKLASLALDSIKYMSLTVFAISLLRPIVELRSRMLTSLEQRETPSIVLLCRHCSSSRNGRSIENSIYYYCFENAIYVSISCLLIDITSSQIWQLTMIYRLNSEIKIVFRY